MDTATLREKLLAHYDERHRELPWRGTTDPYAVWVSEVMLQQTRVEAVVPYYERWLSRFPTLDTLADASVDDVLKAWEGLGYYRRARSLHAAAQVVRERHHGALPADTAALRDLPGVGVYTAGAIASIAFGIPEPAVDGNVRRVLARLYDLEEPRDAELRELAAALVPGDRPGDFNQALMELGATNCTPGKPDCQACPLAQECLARARGVQDRRPRPRSRKRVPERVLGVAVARRPDGRVLLVRRPEDGLLGGLWEFPGARPAAGETPLDAAVRRLADLGLAPHDGAAPLPAVDHTFSHFRASYRGFVFQWARAPARRVAARHVWRWPADVADLALPVAQQRIAALADEAG